VKERELCSEREREREIRGERDFRRDAGRGGDEESAVTTEGGTIKSPCRACLGKSVNSKNSQQLN